LAFIEVDELDFQDVLDAEFAKGQIVILKFGSQFCDACNALDFELEEIDDKYDNVSVLEIDCSESEDLTQMYAIQEVPTMVIYENKDSVLWHSKGVVLAQDIEKLIAS